MSSGRGYEHVMLAGKLWQRAFLAWTEWNLGQSWGSKWRKPWSWNNSERESHKLGSALVCTNTRGTGTTCRAILFGGTWKQSTFLPPCPHTSIEHPTPRRQRCVPQCRRRKKRPWARHVPPSCLVQCVGEGVSLSRLQEGNHGLAQANCSWLKNLQVAKKKNLGSNAHTLTLNSILNYPESPPKSFSLSLTLLFAWNIIHPHIFSSNKYLQDTNRVSENWPSARKILR